MIDQKIAGTGSALRSQFGAAVASAVDEADTLGRPRREGGRVDFEASRDRQAVTVDQEVGEGVLVTRSRQVARSKNGQAIHGVARQQGPNGITTKQRSVITDGKRRPSTVMVQANDSHEGANGTFQRQSQQVFNRSKWGGGAVLEQEESSTTRTGALASEGNQLEQDSAKVWGRGKFKTTQRRTIANNGQERLVNTSAERKLGGLLTVHKAEGFATTRSGKMKQVGTSRQVTFGNKTLNLGRQRADRTPPTRWTPRDATATRGRLGGRGR